MLAAPSRSSTRARRRAALLIAGLTSVLSFTPQARAQEEDRIGAFRPLVGGTWIGEGTWPDGSPMRVEQRYFWGPTERILHFHTWDLVDGRRDLLYEGVVYVDPVSGRVVQINVKTNGEVTRQEVARSDGAGYEISGPQTRSTVRYEADDVFTWELRVRQEDEWKVILTAEYRRHPQAGGGAAR